MRRLGDLALRVAMGLSRAGAAVGADCALHRPRGLRDPLAPSHFIQTLPAAFAPREGSPMRAPGYGEVLVEGYFDTGLTRPGDYLVRPASRPGAADGAVWFIAGLEALRPALCVRAGRVVSLTRPAGTGSAGVAGYGGAAAAAETPLLAFWPAGVIEAGAGGAAQAGLPAAPGLASWSVLLPASSGVVLRPGDLLSDDLGRAGVVAAAELSALGWRLSVKQTAG